MGQLFNGIEKQLEQAIGKATADFTQDVVRGLRDALTGEVLNVRSGRLLRSIKVLPLSPTEVLVSSDVDYGFYWERGIRRKNRLDRRAWFSYGINKAGGRGAYRKIAGGYLGRAIRRQRTFNRERL